MLFIDGLDGAIIGQVGQSNVYSYDLILQIFVRHHGWPEDDAVDWFYFNIAPLGMMENGPYFWYGEDECYM